MITVQQVVDYWNGHGTKILGTATLVVASALGVPELISAEHVKYWLFANALLGGFTVKRGFTNSKAQE
jgi:hypothetical protein